jgi:hypothetical protein
VRVVFTITITITITITTPPILGTHTILAFQCPADHL